MTQFSVKLVNHTQATDRLKLAIKQNLQDLFDQSSRGPQIKPW
jgi:hypothetical protein